MSALNKTAVKLAFPFLLLLPLACAAIAQQPDSPSTNAGTNSAFPPGGEVPKVDEKTHQAAIRLMAAIGIKEKLAASMDSFLDDGVNAMKVKVPDVRPEFVEEWRRRMKARMNPDDFVAVAIRVYEKYFTADELDHLTAAAAESAEGKTPVLDDALREKYQKNAIAIQSEIIGGAAQIGAKLGAESAEEIAKEHPEWASKPASSPAPIPK